MSPLVLDTLESQFGSCELTVIKQSARTRIAEVRSVRTGKVVEVAYTWFMPLPDATYESIDTEVRNGSPMGRAYRSAGVPFYREVTSSYRLKTPRQLKSFFPDSTHISVIKLNALVGNERSKYAEIVEIFAQEVDVGEYYG